MKRQIILCVAAATLVSAAWAEDSGNGGFISRLRGSNSVVKKGSEATPTPTPEAQATSASAETPTTPVVAETPVVAMKKSTSTEKTEAAVVASSASGQKVGFVDLDEITRTSRYVRRVASDVEKQLTPKRDQIEQKRQQLSQMGEEIERKKSVLSEKEMEGMLRKARELRASIESDDYEMQTTLKKAEKGTFAPAMDQVFKTIETVAHQEGCGVVLRGEAVLYGAPSNNLTSRVISRLDADEPTSGTATVASTPASAKKTPEASKTTKSKTDMKK
ncbi:TPA: hypothetical protein DDW35_07900 [Candidatus Sumerlaeota bacterium]|nr:hypothetical protein [Candidatus Sumerlaeota bacterium]